MLEIKEKITYINPLLLLVNDYFIDSIHRDSIQRLGILLTIAIFYDLQEPAGCLNGDLIFILTIFLIIAILTSRWVIFP